jgi:predicted oxidoreductase (fatty acid repression mutant protein)
MRDFYQAIKNRRSYYGLSNQSPLSDDDLIRKIKEITKDVPSAFNSQSSKVIVLLGKEHRHLWDIVMETLRKIVPPAAFPSTESKIKSFAAGYGTLLFFDDAKITNTLIEKYPLYKDNFIPWAEQSNGMLQYAIWTMLNLEGYGVSLQHYNPLIDEEVKEVWKVPLEWRLIGQMPFGKPTQVPGPREDLPIEERVLVVK